MFDIRYVSGLFDGEGCIAVTVGKKGTYKGYSDNYRRYQLHVGIGMTHQPTMLQMQAQFGGGRNLHRLQNLKHRACYYWKLSSDPASNFLQSILPWLFCKKEEAELAIELQKHIRENRGLMRYHPEVAEEMYAHRQQLVDRMRISKRPIFTVDRDPMPAA